jgi:hypothetical protein
VDVAVAASLAARFPPPPARTTLVAGFALPAVLVKLQAIAAPR